MDYDTCTIWDPSILKQPAIPLEVGRFIPLYPVFITRFSPNSLKRGWFWLWECTICGEERIMSKGHTIYSNCKCYEQHKSEEAGMFPFPRKEMALCCFCTNPFEYIKTSATHIIKYCSPECIAAAKSTKHKKWMQDHPRISKIQGFDRVKICMEYDGISYALCDLYHQCLDYRIKGTVGPHYKSNKECYVFSGINIV